MSRSRWAGVVGAVVVAVAAGTSGGQEPKAAPKACHGKVSAVTFSTAKYPNIKRHWEITLRKGYPKVYVLNRKGADERREKLLATAPPQPKGDHLDLDELPPALGRRVVRADLLAVPERENRSHGASMGGQLRKYRDGTCFRFAWTP